MPWQLMVIDGADTDRFFPLPDAGSRIIGNSHKYADICLNDLIAARVHCQVDTDGETVSVTSMADDKETLVNGQMISQCELHEGDVLRVGNSFLRLENPDAPAPELEAFEEVVDDADPADVVDDVVADDVVEDVAVEEPQEVQALVAEDLPEVEWDELDRLTGYRLGHFEIGPMLGRGFHGAVFRAKDHESHREVALKIIGREFPQTPEELQRFAKYVKAASKIHEEHLVTWFAAGKTGPYCWISQELIEGESLAQVIEKGEPANKVTWRHALKMATDLAKALDTLFQRKIIHGNLVPANVLVRVTDRTVKLNDLLFHEALKDSVWYTERMEGKLLSELPYLPPERVEPGAFWDSLADIYSLGALVYAHLTGKPPFQGATAGDTIERIRKGTLEPPKNFVKEIPDAFQTVILKMLSRSQEERYQTPRDLLRDLDHIQALA